MKINYPKNSIVIFFNFIFIENFGRILFFELRSFPSLILLYSLNLNCEYKLNKYNLKHNKNGSNLIIHYFFI
jgi:hypothetical protein